MNPMNKTAGHWKGVGNTLLAAALFGASTPLAKAISPHVEPVLMAGLLNLGSGLGLATYAGLRAGRMRTTP